MTVDPLLARIGIDAVTRALRSWKQKASAKAYKQLISAAVAELLKQHPDLDVAQADLLAAEVTGVKPSTELLRAKGMLEKARIHIRAFKKVEIGWSPPVRKARARRRPAGKPGRYKKR